MATNCKRLFFEMVDEVKIDLTEKCKIIEEYNCNWATYNSHPQKNLLCVFNLKQAAL